MNITGIEIKRNPGVAIGVVTGEKVELTYGDTLHVNVSFDYRGLARTATLYGAIGNRGLFGFGEILHNEVSIDLPESLDFTPCERSVDIAITSDISPDTNYDLYVKIKEYPEAGMPEADDVIDIVGVPPVYELVYQHEYPRGKTYVGKAEECTTTLTVSLPEQLFPNNWVIEKIADTFAEEVAKEGGEMLDIKIYEDATPTWHTDYKIVATAIASPLPWTPILLLVLAIILVVAFLNLVVEFKDIDWGEIPAPIPWAILALAGGLGVLGVGAAMAFTMAKPAE